MSEETKMVTIKEEPLDEIPDSQKYPCSFENCLRTFGVPSKLNHQIRVHNDERPFICDFPGCEKGFLQPYHLTFHKKCHDESRTRFVCFEDNCMKVFKSMYVLEKHIARVHSNRNFKCQDCEKRFHDVQQLLVHSYIHTNIKPFECLHEGCNKRFLIPSKLKAHQLQHMDYVCTEENCGLHLDSKISFKKHMAFHCKKDVTCNICHKKFISISNLNQHLVIHSDNRRVYQCTESDCLATYYKLSSLNIHMRVKHDVMQQEGSGVIYTSKRPFKCDFPGCKKSYTRSFHLTRHKKSHDENAQNGPRFVCIEENCMKTFKSMYILERHCKRFHENRKFKCQECEKRFHKKQHLLVHSYIHTNIKPFACPHKNCGKRFLVPSKLKAHQSQHIDFVCTEENCGVELDSKLSLKKHMAIHYKAVYKCNGCEKVFETQTKLTKHSVIHAIKREVYHCPKNDCTCRYFKMSSLNAHIKIKHEGKRFPCKKEGCLMSYTSKQKLKIHAQCHEPGYVKKYIDRRKSMAVKLSGFTPQKQYNLEMLINSVVKPEQIESEAVEISPSREVNTHEKSDKEDENLKPIDQTHQDYDDDSTKYIGHRKSMADKLSGFNTPQKEHNLEMLINSDVVKPEQIESEAEEISSSQEDNTIEKSDEEDNEDLKPTDQTYQDCDDDSTVSYES